MTTPTSQSSESTTNPDEPNIDLGDPRLNRLPNWAKSTPTSWSIWKKTLWGAFIGAAFVFAIVAYAALDAIFNQKAVAFPELRDAVWIFLAFTLGGGMGGLLLSIQDILNSRKKSRSEAGEKKPK